MPCEDLGSTPPLRCGHCGNVAPLQVRARDSRVTTHEAPGTPGASPWDAGTVYEVLACPACDQVSLARYEYHEVWIEDGVEYLVLYPADRAAPDGLPGAVAAAYAAAQRVRHVDANAFGAAVRRVLERACADRGAAGRTLYHQLQNLATRGEIPAKLVAVADGLRQLGNVGAHGGAEGLTGAEVSLLDDLARAVLEYVYTAPLLAERAAERLRRIQGRGA